MTGQFDNICFLFDQTVKMQMMNRRPDSENGSTVKSPAQEAVIGQLCLPFVVLDHTLNVLVPETNMNSVSFICAYRFTACRQK